MDNFIPLEQKTWKPFCIGDIAEIVSGKNINAEDRRAGELPYITASAVNNGVSDFVSNINETLEENCISVNANGSVGYAFYHSYAALYSNDCRKIRLHHHRNKYVSLFIAQQITAQREKYNYGYKMGTARLKRQKIMLPVNELGEPDYEYMENYIRRIEEKILSEYQKFLQAPETVEVVPLNQKVWKAFLIGDLFKLEAGKSKGLNYLKTEGGTIPYLGATNRNNGVLAFVQPVENLIQRGNCIAFIRNGEGSIGYSVYKSEDFIATSDITCGYADFLNKYVGQFITTVADKVRGKYNFNYKRSDTRLKKEKILLPVNEIGEPDFEYMEAYIKNIFAEKLQRYLEFRQ